MEQKVNTGVIETGKAGLSKVVGVYLGQNTTLNNQGSIKNKCNRWSRSLSKRWNG